MEYIYSHELLADKGEYWSDFPDYWELYKREKKSFPKSIHIWYGQFLDKVQVEYEGKAMPQHGGSEPGGYVSFDFAPGEYIVFASLTYMPFGCSEHMIRDFEVRTTKGKTYAFHSWSENRNGAKSVEFAIPQGYALAAIGGTTGYYNPQAPCCIAGMVFYYSRIDGASTQGFWTEKRLEMPEGLQAMCLFTPNGAQEPSNGKWVNAMVDIHAPAGCKLFCASVSGDAGQVAMPADVRTTLYDNSGKKVLESGSPQCRIRNYKGNFYQLYKENSGEQNYQLHICMKSDAKICLDVQSVTADLPGGVEGKLEEIGFPQGKSGLPLFLRPVYQIDIVEQDSRVADPMAGGARALSLYWWWQIEDFLIKLGPYGIAAAIVLGIGIAIAIIIKVLSKGGGVEDVRKALQKEVDKKLPWGNPSTEDAGVYGKVEREGYGRCMPDNSEIFYEVDRDVLDFYRIIFHDNRGNMSAASLKQITENQIRGNKPLIIDVGGEGRFTTYGINSGNKGALNFNGRYKNSQVISKVVPMLIHFQDWNIQKFPLADNIVDIFMMQGAGTPTFMQACEMVRCLKKGKGARMDFWVTNDSGEKCYKIMASALQKHVKKGCKVSFKKWKETDIMGVYGFSYCDKPWEQRIFSIIIE